MGLTSVYTVRRKACVRVASGFMLVRRISGSLRRTCEVAEPFAQLGLASGLLVAVADYLGVVTGQYTGDRWLLAPYLLALELLVLALVAALLGFWVSASAWIGKRAGVRSRRLPRFEVWLRALLTCLPWAGMLAWIPSSWIAEHWAELQGAGRALAVMVYPAMLLAALVGARVLDSLFRGAPEKRPRWLFGAVGAGALSMAAAFYWMDRHLYVGLYEDFHYGLAALGVNAVFLGLWSVRASLLGAHAPFGAWLGWRWITRASLVAALCTMVTLELVRPAIFGPSQSLVFAKLVHSLRSASDFDEDGVSSWMGGSDCAPFDARVTPGKFDLPGNDLDEDCSGTSAIWPEPHRTGKYQAPKRESSRLRLGAKLRSSLWQVSRNRRRRKRSWTSSRACSSIAAIYRPISSPIRRRWRRSWRTPSSCCPTARSTRSRT